MYNRDFRQTIEYILCRPSFASRRLCKSLYLCISCTIITQKDVPMIKRHTNSKTKSVFFSRLSKIFYPSVQKLSRDRFFNICHKNDNFIDKKMEELRKNLEKFESPIGF